MEERSILNILRRMIIKTRGFHVRPGGYIDIDVTFPNEFSDVPKLIACFESTSSAAGFGSCNIGVHDVTKTGGVIRMFNNDSGTRAPYIVWIAVVPEILAGWGYSIKSILLKGWC